MGQCQAQTQQAVEVVHNLPLVGRERRFQKKLTCATKIHLTRLDKKRLEQRKAAEGPQSLRTRALFSPQSQTFRDEYIMLDTAVGHGMSGDVRLAECRSTGGVVAVKKLQKKGLTQKQQKDLLNEVDIHKSLDHANIVRLLHVFHETDAIYLVLEYCSGGTLKEKLEKKGRFSEEEAAAVIHQVLSAVRYCHGRPSGKIAHRDLKLANFAYSHEGPNAVLKLLDFGLSGVLAPGQTFVNDFAGTLEYIAPEVLRDEEYTEACDLWSIGVMAQTLLAGNLPFDGVNDEETTAAILQATSGYGLQIETIGISDGAQAFVKTLLRADPEKRPTAEAALVHPWVSSHAEAAETSSRRPSRESCVDILQSIENFATENPLRRASANLAILGQIDLNTEDVKQAEMQFDHIDSDGNGTISRKELTDVLQKDLGITSERSAWVFDQLDLDGDLEIQRSEFLAAVVGARLLRSEMEVQKAFKCLNRSKPGIICQKDLTGIFGDSFCGKSTKDMFAEIDTNADRTIDFSEFSAMVVDTSKDDVIEISV